MKNTYKTAMDHVSLSKESRERILQNVLTHQSTPAMQKPSLACLRPAFAAVACLIVIGGAVAVTYLRQPGNEADSSLSLPSQQSAASPAPEATQSGTDAEASGEANVPQQTAPSDKQDSDGTVADKGTPLPRSGLAVHGNVRESDSRESGSSLPSSSPADEELPTNQIAPFVQSPQNPTAASESATRKENTSDAGSSDVLSDMSPAPPPNEAQTDKSAATELADVPEPNSAAESFSGVMGATSGSSNGGSGGGGAASSSSASVATKSSAALERIPEATLAAQRNADCGFAYLQLTRLPSGYQASGSAQLQNSSVSIRYTGPGNAITLTAENRSLSVSWPHESLQSGERSISIAREGGLVVRAAWYEGGVTYTIEAPDGLDTNTLLAMIGSMGN